MLLTKVTLENYGVFRNKNEFDFTCTNKKPIILIGGRNGAGKTTLFESVILCLYGQSFFEKKISNKDYEKFLSNKIHRYLGTRATADSTSVTVEFKFFHQETVDLYSITRDWHSEDGKIVEKFSVKINDKPLDSIEQSEWQTFIQGLIPRGISKLFFFDGEKIQKMAEEGNEDIEIKSSFDVLLGLDLVEQLKSDLRVHILRLTGGKEKEILAQLDRLVKEKGDIQDNNGQLIEKLAIVNGEIEGVTKEIGVLESKVSKLGGGYASKREELKTRKTQLETRLSIVEINIRELCTGLLPFCLIPKELMKVSNQLKIDEEVVKETFEKDILEKNFNKIKKEISSDSIWSKTRINDHDKKEIISKLSEIFEKKIGEEKPNQAGIINFSVMETNHILELIDKINDDFPQQLEKETLQYNEITEELTKIQTALANAPRDDEIGPMITEINSLYEKIGSLKKECEHLEQKIATNNSLIKIINAKLKNLIEEKQKDKKTSAQTALAEKVQLILDEYGMKLKERKLQLLEKYLLESLGTLMHKTNFIDKISINKETFEIVLCRKDGTEIDKDSLSKGEKQMLATSVLWALAKTSGKPLPFIIDTPLARLDLEHRANLVEKFLPFASHQVAIFSTNSEIDEKFYSKMKPFISRSYQMNYEPKSGVTQVQKGYFWDAKEDVVAL